MDIKKIAVVIAGEYSHRDPVVANILLQALKMIEGKNIPCYFCEEESYDVTLEEALNGNKQWIQQNEEVIKNLNLSKFLVTSGTVRPHFNWDDFSNISNLVASKYDDSDNITHGLMRDLAFRESIKLKEYLILRAVPYIGLESSLDQRTIDCSKYNQNMILSVLTQNLRQDNRAEIMSDSLWQLICTIKSNAIIFLRCGIDHLDQLGKMIPGNFNNRLKSPSDYRLFLSAAGLRSVYSSTSRPQFPVKTAIYDCLENRVTQDFVCQEFFQIIDKAVEYILKAN